jgi:transcription elongation factor GreA
MIEKKYYLTKNGLKDIKKELYEMKKEKREKLKDNSPVVFHSEDVNPDYLLFSKDMEFLKEKIAKLEDVLQNIEMIKKPEKNCKEILMGAKIILEINGKKEKIMIVGTMEADPINGKISNESPIGIALMGKKEGESVSVFSGDKKNIYKIKKVLY